MGYGCYLSVRELRRSSIPLNRIHPDGGGIRGLSELIILKEVLDRIRFAERLAETPRPCDYFDLIGGTSTGG